MKIMSCERCLKDLAFLAIKEEAMKSYVSLVPWNHYGMPLNCQVMCWMLPWQPKGLPATGQCQGLVAHTLTLTGWDLPGPRSTSSQEWPAGEREAWCPCHLRASQLRCLMGPDEGTGCSLPHPIFLIHLQGCLPAEVGSGQRQTGKQATTVIERLGMGTAQDTMVVWT